MLLSAAGEAVILPALICVPDAQHLSVLHDNPLRPRANRAALCLVRHHGQPFLRYVMCGLARLARPRLAAPRSAIRRDRLTRPRLAAPRSAFLLAPLARPRLAAPRSAIRRERLAR